MVGYKKALAPSSAVYFFPFPLGVNGERGSRRHLIPFRSLFSPLYSAHEKGDSPSALRIYIYIYKFPNEIRRLFHLLPCIVLENGSLPVSKHSHNPE